MKGPGGSSTWMLFPAEICPPARTMAMTPALRMRLPLASREMHAAMRPGRRSFIWEQGVRRPVSSTTALPRWSWVPSGRSRRSRPEVVMFSPSSPGKISKPCVWSSARRSDSSRWTWQRLGWVGIFADEVAVTDEGAAVGVALHAEAGEKRDGELRLFAEDVLCC